MLKNLFVQNYCISSFSLQNINSIKNFLLKQKQLGPLRLFFEQQAYIAFLYNFSLMMKQKHQINTGTCKTIHNNHDNLLLLSFQHVLN